MRDTAIRLENVGPHFNFLYSHDGIEVEYKILFVCFFFTEGDLGSSLGLTLNVLGGHHFSGSLFLMSKMWDGKQA